MKTSDTFTYCLQRNTNFRLKIIKTSYENQTGYRQECVSSCQSSPIACCQKDLCNSFELKPIVTSCFVGGEYNSPNGLLLGQRVEIKVCESPKNQYCTTQKGTLSLVTIDTLTCTDVCFPVTKSDMNITCCQKENCNNPNTRVTLSTSVSTSTAISTFTSPSFSCIKSFYDPRDFSLKPINCPEDQKFCLVVKKLTIILI